MDKAVIKKNSKKTLKALAIAALNLHPVSASFTTFFNEFVNSSWQERIEKTQEELFKKFTELDEEFENKIKERKNFASLLATAYQSALSDVEQDKIPLYINSLINAINNENIDNTKIHIFMNFLKDFTLLHVKVLKFFSSVQCKNTGLELNCFRPQTNEERNASIIRSTRPELISDINLFNVIMNDLYTKKLLQIKKLSDITPNNLQQEQGISVKFTTVLGDEFLTFIKEHDKKVINETKI